jgi:hypothetical protein
MTGGQRRRPSPVQQWVEEVAALFRSGSAADRERAAGTLERDLHFAGGPTYLPDELLAAFRREVESGGLASVPEAHLALARALVEGGETAAAREHVASATSTAGTIAASDLTVDRARASDVNLRAARLFYQMGDARRGRARHAISRYYAATANNRINRLPVPWDPRDPARPAGPAMRAPEPAVPVPRALERASEAEDARVPERVGEPFVAVMGVVDLLNAAAPYVELFRKTAEVARYNEARERAAFFRDYVPVPPPLEVVRKAEQFVEANLHAGPPLGDAARRARATVDFDFLEECSRAFWGR